MKIPPWLHRLFHFIRSVIKAFINDHCFEFAGSLAFSTVLSIIPLAIVVVWILSGFEEITRLSLQAQDYVLENLVPEAAAGVREYILTLSQRSTKIPHYGFGFLIFTSMLLLYAVDSSINHIWKADAVHRKSLRAMMYFLILVFLPILLGLSLMITSLIASLPYVNVGLSFLKIEYLMLGVSPLLLSTLMLTLLFKYSPRVHVQWKHALTGAIVAGMLFEFSKYVFSWYMIQFPNYEMVYGAISFLPIFLIWIYLSWCIILLGAEISYCSSISNTTNHNRYEPDATTQ